MGSLSELGWRRIAFSLVVLAFLGLLGLINMLLFLPDWMGWMPFNAADKISAMGHFSFRITGEIDDLIHELVFSLILGTSAVGLLAQLWKPSENIAGQLMALLAWIALILTAFLTNNWVPQPLFIMFGGLTLLATILHPKGLDLLRWFSFARLNRVLLMLTVIAAVPLIPFAVTNINFQRESGGAASLFNHTIPSFHGGSAATKQETPKDKPLDEVDHEQMHGGLGHFRNFAALSFIIIGLGLLASLRPKGWRLVAWVAGFLPILLGLASVVFPHAESSLGLIWAIAAIAWGIHFVVMAEFIHRGVRIHSGLVGHPNFTPLEQ